MTSELRGGFSSAEMVMGILILAAALVPMYPMFIKSSTRVTTSRISYMALHAAREELEEVRQIPLSRLTGHSWESVRGNLFRRTVLARSTTPGANAVGQMSSLVYPKEYERIETRLTIGDVNPPDTVVPPRMRKVIVDVRWQENGAGTEVQREATGHFETIVSSGNLEN